mgnify:FL=1
MEKSTERELKMEPTDHALTVWGMGCQILGRAVQNQHYLPPAEIVRGVYLGVELGEDVTLQSDPKGAYRIRQEDDSYFFTIKARTGQDSLEASETTFVISEAQFYSLYTFRTGSVLKERFSCTGPDGFRWDVDHYLEWTGGKIDRWLIEVQEPTEGYVPPEGFKRATGDRARLLKAFNIAHKGWPPDEL